MYHDVFFYALRAFLAPPIKADLPEVLSETALHASSERLPTFFSGPGGLVGLENACWVGNSSMATLGEESQTRDSHPRCFLILF